MPTIGVFGDEIAADIKTQIEVMLAEGVRALELRGAEGQGVMDLAGATRDDVRARLTDAGIEVLSIGSPLGKVPIGDPLEAEVERTRRAAEQAHFFGTRRIRVFSFYMAPEQCAEHRQAVMDRLGAMAELAEREDVLLCHENESGIYGESVANCRDILETINSPALRAVHDTCNYLHKGHEAFPAGYEAVKPWLEYVHIKDWGQGTVQPAGEGDGRMKELFAALRADGFDGYLSLEPHIGGGPDNFRRAARALRSCLTEIGWNWE
ncbi:MAG: sugar phosphate isomerase/epimerase [Armatimonadetes bacterium]|nr:sugar phosphate isomerase/epimerase [Armatimonadota bacterium]